MRILEPCRRYVYFEVVDKCFDQHYDELMKFHVRSMAQEMGLSSPELGHPISWLPSHVEIALVRRLWGATFIGELPVNGPLHYV